MAALVSKPGLTNASAGTVPMAWSASWYKGFISNLLQGGDVRNAVGINGIVVSGNIASPYATIGFSAPVALPGPVTITDATAGGNSLTVSAPGANGVATGVNRAGVFLGRANSYAVEIDGSTTSGQSYGLLINAGTTSADNSLLIQSSGGTGYFKVRGDGAIQGFSVSAAGFVDMSPDSATATGTLTGCTTSPTASITLRRIGNLVMIFHPGGQTGTASAATTCTVTGAIPAAFQPTNSQWFSFVGILNAGAGVVGACALVTAGSSTLTLSNGVPGNQSSFGAGSKGVNAGCVGFYILS